MKNILKEMEYFKRSQDEEKMILMKKIEQNDITIRKMEQEIFEIKRGCLNENSNNGGRRASLKKPNTAFSSQSHARSTILISNQDYVTMFEHLTNKGKNDGKAHNEKILSHKLIQSYQKNQEESKLNDYKISRLVIQVKQKNKEIEKLENINKE